MNKKLSILIPVYNEEKTILSILKRIDECRIDDFDFEIIVINDGSTDNTLKIKLMIIKTYLIGLSILIKIKVKDLR